MIAVLLLTAAYGGGEEGTDPDLVSTHARHATTAGAIEVGVGSAAVLGGLGLVLVGRPAGEVSEEDNAAHDARTIGGSVLIIAGLTTVALGIDSLSRGARLREQATRETTVHLSPLLVPRGGGVSLDLTF